MTAVSALFCQVTSPCFVAGAQAPASVPEIGALECDKRVPVHVQVDRHWFTFMYLTVCVDVSVYANMCFHDVCVVFHQLQVDYACSCSVFTGAAVSR